MFAGTETPHDFQGWHTHKSISFKLYQVHQELRAGKNTTVICATSTDQPQLQPYHLRWQVKILKRLMKTSKNFWTLQASTSSDRPGNWEAITSCLSLLLCLCKCKILSLARPYKDSETSSFWIAFKENLIYFQLLYNTASAFLYMFYLFTSFHAYNILRILPVNSNPDLQHRYLRCLALIQIKILLDFGSIWLRNFI